MRARLYVVVGAVVAGGCVRGGLDFTDPGEPAPTGSTWTNPSAPPAVANWKHRRRIDVDVTTTNSVLTDVPVLVRLDPTGFDYARVASDAADLRFLTRDGETMAHEVDSWSIGGVSEIWVRAPVVDPADTDAHFWMYYDAPDAASVEDPPAVWANGFVGVWHLSADLSDSTVYANDVSVVSAQAATGLIGGGEEFNGSQQAFLVVPNAPSLSPTQQLSISAWVFSNDWNGGNRRILQKGDSDNQYRFLREGPMRFDMPNVGRVDGSLPALDEWHFVAATYDGAALRLYLDGEQDAAAGGSGNVPVSNDNLHIGAKYPDAGAGDHFDGTLDEVRVAGVAHSQDWFRVQYASMVDALVTLGAQESPGGGG